MNKMNSLTRKKMKTRMQWLALTLASVSAVPALSQATSDEAGVAITGHAHHQGSAAAGTKDMADKDHANMGHSSMPMSEPAMPGMDHGSMPMAQPAMQGMDHAEMDHGSMPMAQPAMQGMDHAKMNNVKKATSQPAMSGMEHGNMQSSAPASARSAHEYADGYTLDSGKYALPGPRQLRLADEHSFASVAFNRLERGVRGDGTAYDVKAWFGRDYERLVIKAEGEVAEGKLQDARTEVLWGHALTPFWDTQLGLRHDAGVGPSRNWLAMGVEGLAPYWFDVEATLYVGDGGRTAFRLGAEYDLLLTQKLVLQPSVSMNAYGKRDAERDIGSGFSSSTVGLRLRYEINRQFAPYIGVEHSNKFGDTKALARAAFEPSAETRWVAGVRAWF
ncbi:MAG: copper resistance protein B [Janthinobacterium sp.]|jgi:copper resistance protein B